MGYLIGSSLCEKMGSLLVCVVTALAVTCQGAILPGEHRQKRDLMAGNLDKSFDLPGFHLGIKYKDASQPLKGATIHLKFDTLKRINKYSPIDEVDLEIEFDGQDSTSDRIFNC